jgi:hypothetical protein
MTGYFFREVGFGTVKMTNQATDTAQKRGLL